MKSLLCSTSSLLSDLCRAQHLSFRPQSLPVQESIRSLNDYSVRIHLIQADKHSYIAWIHIHEYNTRELTGQVCKWEPSLVWGGGVIHLRTAPIKWHDISVLQVRLPQQAITQEVSMPLWAFITPVGCLPLIRQPHKPRPSCYEGEHDCHIAM